MASHLEQLLGEYYEWQGCLVRRNIHVGKQSRGGHETELDIVAYHPQKKQLLHIEPSLDGHTWTTREVRYKKKFDAGRKYIFEKIFPWLDTNTQLQQIAIFPSAGKTRRELAGGQVRTVDEVMAEIRDAIKKEGSLGRKAISEQFPLLRTVQLVMCGLVKPINTSNDE